MRPNPAKHKLEFNDRWLKTLPPSTAVTADGKPRHTLYWDSVSPLIVKTTPNGIKTFMTTYAAAAGQRWYVIDRYPKIGIAEARKVARGIRAEVAAGGDPHAVKLAARAAARARRAQLTFDKLADMYLAAHSAMKSVTVYKGLIARTLRPKLGRKLAIEITADDAADIVATIAADAPGSAKQVRAVGSALYAWAITARKVRGIANPFSRIAIAKGNAGVKPGRRRSRGGTRTRFYSDAEIKAIWAACARLPDKQAEVGSIVKLMLLTGARKNEVVKMTWGEIDGNWWTLPVARSKTDEHRRIWLSDLACQSIGSRGKGRVFKHATKHRIAEAWAAIEQMTGIEKLDAVEGAEMEDTRRTLRTHVVERGIADELLAERMLGHKPQGIMAVYGRESLLDRLQAAFNGWSDRVIEITKPKLSVAA